MDGPSASQSIVRPHGWSPDHLRTAEHLRREFHIKPSMPLSLSILPDPPNGSRPGDIRKVLELVVFSSSEHKLTVQEIYEALEKRYVYYRSMPREGWMVGLDLGLCDGNPLLRRFHSLFSCRARSERNYRITTFSKGSITQGPMAISGL